MNDQKKDMEHAEMVHGMCWLVAACMIFCIGVAVVKFVAWAVSQAMPFFQ